MGRARRTRPKETGRTAKLQAPHVLISYEPWRRVMGMQNSVRNLQVSYANFVQYEYARDIRDLLAAKAYSRSSAHNRGSQPTKILLLLDVLQGQVGSAEIRRGTPMNDPIIFGAIISYFVYFIRTSYIFNARTVNKFPRMKCLLGYSLVGRFHQRL